MKIPVFLSCPTIINPAQKKGRLIIKDMLHKVQCEPRALGRSDYPSDLPLREVYTIAKHCSGGIILGFSQFKSVKGGVFKQGTPEEKKLNTSVEFPTPWNNLEAGILFGMHLPLLIFKEKNIEGGVFDPGVTDVFVHQMPSDPFNSAKKNALRQVFLKWSSKVRDHYYSR